MVSSEVVAEIQNALQTEAELKRQIAIGHVGIVITSPRRNGKDVEVFLLTHRPGKPLGPVLGELSEKAMDDRILSACVIRRTGEDSFEDLVSIYAG